MYRCVNKKNDEKGYFFRAGQCAALSSFRVGNMLFLKEKGMCFTNFTKGCRIREYVFLIYYIGKGYFLTGQSEKGYQFQNVEHTI